MLSWRSFNVDEMVRVVFAEKGSLSSKEVGHRKVPSVVGLAVVLGGFPSAAGIPHPDAVVRVVADDDGVVPRCLGEGVPQSPAWCSTLQMTAPSGVLRISEMSPMESMALRSQ